MVLLSFVLFFFDDTSPTENYTALHPLPLHDALPSWRGAVGQEDAIPWIERDAGIEVGEWDRPVVDKVTHQSSLPHVLFGGDAAFGPKNIIWAVAHGHAAAISIDKLLHGEDTRERPDPMVQLESQKMGIHEWSYDNAVSPDERYAVPWS